MWKPYCQASKHGRKRTAEGRGVLTECARRNVIPTRLKLILCSTRHKLG